MTWLIIKFRLQLFPQSIIYLWHLRFSSGGFITVCANWSRVLFIAHGTQRPGWATMWLNSWVIPRGHQLAIKCYLYGQALVCAVVSPHCSAAKKINSHVRVPQKIMKLQQNGAVMSSSGDVYISSSLITHTHHPIQSLTIVLMSVQYESVFVLVSCRNWIALREQIKPSVSVSVSPQIFLQVTAFAVILLVIKSSWVLGKKYDPWRWTFWCQPAVNPRCRPICMSEQSVSVWTHRK